MEVQWLIPAVVGIAVTVILHRPLCSYARHSLQKRGMLRANYQGRQVLTAGGVIVAGSILAALLPMLWIEGIVQSAPLRWREGALLGAGVAAAALWGWQDDCAADGRSKGFRGHFTALLRERRITSGMWKVWGGGSTGAAVALALSSETFWSWLVAASLLALSPNVLNLFDLRPVRAVKVYGLLLVTGGVVSFWAGGVTSLFAHGVWQLPVVASVCLWFRHDARESFMLGDTGANALGYCCGYFWVTATPLAAQAAMVLLFVAITIAAEFVSLSEWIERSAWLGRIDRWGRSAEPNE